MKELTLDIFDVKMFKINLGVHRHIGHPFPENNSHSIETNTRTSMSLKKQTKPNVNKHLTGAPVSTVDPI